MVVTINVADYGNYGVIQETLPEGFSYVSSRGASGRLRGDQVEFVLLVQGANELFLHGNSVRHRRVL